MISFRRFVQRSLAFHWRINLAVALGVAAATAVLTGALLVGDSVRGSLRQITLQRLGRIDELLVADRFFRMELAEELAGEKEFATNFDAAVPAMLFPGGTIEFRDDENQVARASGILCVGSPGRSFWDLDLHAANVRQLEGVVDAAERTANQRLIGAGQVVLNATLARELNVQVGDDVMLRLPKTDQVPAESLLGDKSGRIRGIPDLTVIAILPDRGFGRFSLEATQTAPRTAFVALETLQTELEQPGRVNAILVAGKDPIHPPDKDGEEALARMFQPRLTDYGLAIKHVVTRFAAPGEAEETVIDYFSFSSDRMLLSPAVERIARQAFQSHRPQPVMTYLANGIGKVIPDDPEATERNAIPYSMISALDPVDSSTTPPLGPIFPPLKDDEIALTNWAAADQQVAPDDMIRVTYYEPETTHSQYGEVSHDLKLRTIIPLTEPVKPFGDDEPPEYTSRPTLANDPDLTPEVEGVSDVKTIEEWELPFPTNRPLRGQDNVYWSNHRTTPKAYVSLATGQKLWGTRYGRLTSLRIAAQPGLTSEQLESEFLEAAAKNPEALGLTFQPIKRHSLRASSGATPFDVLFLSLSMFIIAAALMLVWLLFRLGVEQRARELGVLLAIGVRRRRAGWMWICEGALVASGGGLIGMLVGIGYAWLMLSGLRTRWVGAIVTPFLEFYITPTSLILGYLIGVMISVLTIAASIFAARRTSNRALLSGRIFENSGPLRRNRWLLVMGLLFLCAAIPLVAAASQLGGEAQAGAFVGGGAAVLTAALLLIWYRLQAGGKGTAVQGTLILLKLAIRSAGRNPSRSVLTIGLIATASFLIVAMSSFRLDPTPAGRGGFSYLAESAQPVFEDLESAAGRSNLLADEAVQLQGTTILSLRLKPGDDASCNNLYQATQPRVISVSQAMVDHFDRSDVQAFGWAGSAAATPAERANPWHLLQNETEGPIPVVLDKNTAMYSLKLYRGIGEEFDVTYDNHETIRFRVVGLLSNSILQGSLLISESHFRKTFPEISGFRFFLIEPPAEQAAKVVPLLEDRLGDQGFDVRSTQELLASLLAVQNTYLETFQSLGALGLLLGTFGLATVQVRSVLERRAELALMRAAGFRRSRLARMVMLENTILLLAGLGLGVLAALIAVLPHMLLGEARIPSGLQTDLALFLGSVLVVGMAAGLLAVRATLRAPLLDALRGD